MNPMDELRKHFPAISNGNYIYLDNAATTQKPKCVIDKIAKLYAEDSSNIHRGVHRPSLKMTDMYEAARAQIAEFIGAESDEVIFTHGATEGINLVAFAMEDQIREGDNIAVTVMEHNSNLLPWQQLCKRRKANLTVIPIDETGSVELCQCERLLTDRTKLLAVAHVFNTNGCKNPIKEIAALARKKGAKILVDAAQSAGHCKIDVKELDCDYLVFSGHKIYGPTGIGVLYGKKECLRSLTPPFWGGGMVADVSLDGPITAEVPYCFEAGTPNYIGAIALAEAIGFLKQIGMTSIEEHSKALMSYLQQGLKSVCPNITVYSEKSVHYGILSFNHNKMHHFDVGKYLDCNRIAARSGTHCCQAGMRSLGIDGTVRISAGIYNNTSDLDKLINCLEKL